MAKPAVHIITTGGTIAATPSGMLTPADLLATIPDLGDLANISVESFLDIGSSWIRPTHWLQLAVHIQALWQTRPELSGIVITHGTDTLEETAYFLHMTGHDPRPVILTGAMRSANALSADGPANLRAAIVTAAEQGARHRGALVVLNNDIHTARHVAKTHTLRVDAFTSGSSGVLGTIYDNEVIWLQPQQAAIPGLFTVMANDVLPRIDIVYSYAGADGELIAAAIAAGAQGIVIAAFGSGRLTEAQIESVQIALAQGVTIVLSSRVGNGSVERNYRRDLAPTDTANGVVLAGDLSPAKARILLMLALTRGQEATSIPNLFAQT